MNFIDISDKKCIQRCFSLLYKIFRYTFSNQFVCTQGGKILIQLDTEPQGYKYTSDKYLLNRFGLFRYIDITHINLLLSQKMCVIFTRKREKGRDFFDVVYLMSKTKPDFKFLKLKFGIESKKELIKGLKEKSKNLNFKILAKDIESFLFEPNQKDRVLYFRDWLNTL